MLSAIFVIDGLAYVVTVGVVGKIRFYFTAACGPEVAVLCVVNCLEVVSNSQPLMKVKLVTSFAVIIQYIKKLDGTVHYKYQLPTLFFQFGIHNSNRINVKNMILTFVDIQTVCPNIYT